jgi:hypothetical protein
LSGARLAHLSSPQAFLDWRERRRPRRGQQLRRGRLTRGVAKTMDAEAERQRGLELGRRWAEHASAHELTTMVSGSFDDLSQILPADTSDHFVGGFREGVLRVWRGA